MTLKCPKTSPGHMLPSAATPRLFTGNSAVFMAFQTTIRRSLEVPESPPLDGSESGAAGSPFSDKRTSVNQSSPTGRAQNPSPTTPADAAGSPCQPSSPNAPRSQSVTLLPFSAFFRLPFFHLPRFQPLRYLLLVHSPESSYPGFFCVSSIPSCVSSKSVRLWPMLFVSSAAVLSLIISHPASSPCRCVRTTTYQASRRPLITSVSPLLSFWSL